MIRGGFLSAVERKDLVSQVRDGLAEHRVARRANAILLLDDGWNCEQEKYVAQTLPRSTREIGAFIERTFGIVASEPHRAALGGDAQACDA
jgi:hypothetical protein